MTTREDGMVERLHAATAHGDQEHRDWLHAAYTAFFAGQPVPAPRGSGRKEKLIREQAATITTLSSEREILRERASALVAKLDECAPHVANLSAMPFVHSGVQYTGPSYGEALEALRAALTGVTGG